jgi:hypothetical protein
MMERRDFLRLAGLGGVVFASGLRGERLAAATRKRDDEFYFVQLSDTHWGFEGPAVNPDSQGTLKKAVAAVNGLDEPPDFVVFTGDLTHTTDDATVRRDRMNQFREIVSGLKTKTVRFMAGEHDASLDRGDVYQTLFGPLHYSFDHKGIHFVVLDNVSDPSASIGPEQIAWLKTDVSRFNAESPIVVLTHRPLFDLYPDWDWATRDGAAALDVLMPYHHVTVFYGHIHQENHHMTGHIAHHSAKSLMFGLPAPGSVAKKAPIPWDVAHPYAALGFREVEAEAAKARLDVTELPVVAR